MQSCLLRLELYSWIILNSLLHTWLIMADNIVIEWWEHSYSEHSFPIKVCIFSTIVCCKYSYLVQNIVFGNASEPLCTAFDLNSLPYITTKGLLSKPNVTQLNLTQLKVTLKATSLGQTQYSHVPHHPTPPPHHNKLFRHFQTSQEAEILYRYSLDQSD